MATRIQLRRGTAAQWTAANPILAEGEQGFETDTKKKKIGDGVSAWTDLPYDASGSSKPVEIPFSAAIPFELENAKSALTVDQDYTLSIGANAVEDSYYMLKTNVNGGNVLIFPSSWISGNGKAFDNTKSQRIIFYYDGEYVIYSIIDLVGTSSDVVKPTVSITSTSSSPTDDNPIPVVFTLSEDSSNFVAGILQLGNCTIENFAGSGLVYTANLIPSGSGNVTINIPADSFTDLAGNGNIAATQFVRAYDPAFNVDANSELYIDASYPETFSLSGTQIIQANDLSGKGKHLTQNIGSKRLNLIGNEIVFDDTALAHLIRSSGLAPFQFQDQTPFTIILKGVNITEAKSQFLLSYRVINGDLGIHHGWSIFYSVGTQTIQMTMMGQDSEGVTIAKNAQYAIGSFTTKTDLIFTNESGVLKIYDAANVNVGTNGSTEISSINYTGLSLMLGSRNPGESTDQYFWTGHLKSLEIISRVLNESERAAKLGL